MKNRRAMITMRKRVEAVMEPRLTKSAREFPCKNTSLPLKKSSAVIKKPAK